MYDGISKLWIVRIDHGRLEIIGYNNELEAISALVRRYVAGDQYTVATKSNAVRKAIEVAITSMSFGVEESGDAEEEKETVEDDEPFDLFEEFARLQEEVALTQEEFIQHFNFGFVAPELMELHWHKALRDFRATFNTDMPPHVAVRIMRDWPEELRARLLRTKLNDGENPDDDSNDEPVMDDITIGTRVRVKHSIYAGTGVVEHINPNQVDGCAYFVRFDDKQREYKEEKVDLVLAGSLSAGSLSLAPGDIRIDVNMHSEEARRIETLRVVKVDFEKDLTTPLPKSAWFKREELEVLGGQDG